VLSLKTISRCLQRNRLETGKEEEKDDDMMSFETERQGWLTF